MFAYSAFGLSIVSPLECPELMPGREPFDVRIRYDGVPDDLVEPTGRGVWYQVSPDQFLLKVPSIARYLVRGGSEIVVDRAPGTSEADVRLYLLGSVFGALLHQRGALPIHGSAIATPRGGVIFAGPSGHGKSTLAWEFHRRGYRHLSDDVSVVGVTEDGRPLVYPAYPQLNLWRDVLDWHGPELAASPTVQPEIQKHAVPTRDTFESAPVPLVAVYVLTTTNLSTLDLTPISGLDKIQVLIANTYRPRFMAAMGKRAAHFRLAATAGRHLLTRRVVRPVHPFRLKELADVIEKDVAL